MLFFSCVISEDFVLKKSDKEFGKLLERFLKNIVVNDGMTDEERAAKRERLEREDKEKLVPEYAGIENEIIMQMFDKK